MKTISGIEFASEHNGTDVFRLIELAYEQGQKDGHSEQHGTNLAEVGTDLISRQAAQTELQLSAKRYTMAHEAHGEGRVVWSEDLISVSDAMDVLRKIPSAQPTFDARDTQYNLPIGTDLISRQALLDKFEPWLKVKDYNDGELNMLKAILYEIRFMRSAQPEIIRCKDCKHWIPYDWMFSEVWQSKNIADYPEDEIGCNCCDMAMKANDFCSRAERRTE